MRTTNNSHPPLDSDLLRSFLAVAKSRSMSGGASLVMRTQSAVSLQIKKLEAIVGQKLFRRHGRGVAITSAGQQLLVTAHEVIGSLDRVANELRSHDAVPTIRFGIPEEYIDSILPTILAEFTKKHPSVRISLQCGPSADFPESIAVGKLDVALHTPYLVCVDDIIVRQEAAIWAGLASSRIESCRPLPVAFFDDACWWQERSIEILTNSGIDYNVVCKCESVAGVRAAIAAGIAVGLLPQWALNDNIRPLTDQAFVGITTTSLVLSRSPAASSPEIMDFVRTVTRLVCNNF